MFGILLARNSEGQVGVLRAFSGRWRGSFHHADWVPPVFEFETTPLEIETKRKLAQLKLEIGDIRNNLVEKQLASKEEKWNRQIAQLKKTLSNNKKERDQSRALGVPEANLREQSRADKRKLRQLKEQARQALGPLRSEAAEQQSCLADLKKRRKTLSRTLQAEMHDAFSHQLWSDRPWSLASLFPAGPPTGVGECCAPKLLSFARRHGLKPLALAEVWWGPSTSERVASHFYPACETRCRPLLGALFSDAEMDFNPIYEDQYILAVNKPTGVLSVPGRQLWNQDSVLRRLNEKHGELLSIHRLDMDTSGILLFAKTAKAQSAFQKLFAGRAITKLYQALLENRVAQNRGVIDLAVGPDPNRAGCHRPCPEGKAAITKYEVMDSANSRVLLEPHTGRSHQLRVHAAFALKSPICGDRLYGKTQVMERLKLHAHSLHFQHPFSKEIVKLESEVPF